MTLSQLVLLASKRGYMFDEKYFSQTGDYRFVTTFDGYSSECVTFGSKLEAELYFTEER